MQYRVMVVYPIWKVFFDIFRDKISNRASEFVNNIAFIRGFDFNIVLLVTILKILKLLFKIDKNHSCYNSAKILLDNT